MVMAAEVDLRTGVWVFADHNTESETGEARKVVFPPEGITWTERLVRAHPKGR